MLGELFLPVTCAGCGAAGERLCARCADALRQPPQLITTRVPVHAPVFALAPYAGAHRSLVLAMKEKNNRAIRGHAGAVIAAGITFAQARGDLPHTLTLVPAPTRPKSARLRGGDPVEAMCRATGLPVTRALSLHNTSADQSELGATERRFNVARSVRVLDRPAGEVLLIDDVVTTGATLAASVDALLGRGVRVAGALALCFA